MPTRPRFASALALALACALAGCSKQSSAFTESSSGTGTGDAVATTGATGAIASTGPGSSTAEGSSAASLSTGDRPSADMSPACGDFWCALDEDNESCPEDCRAWPPFGVTMGCPDAWGGNSAVIGKTSFGDFNGTTAFFGWSGWYDTPQEGVLNLLVFDGADESFQVSAGIQWNYIETMWLGASPALLSVSRAGSTDTLSGFVEVYERAGTWEHYDPADPPILKGALTIPDDPQGIDGPFVAAFCDEFVHQYKD